jgi:hypothetical protein
MRAKTVNETLDFERGLDPKEAMKTGVLWQDRLVKKLFSKLIEYFKIPPASQMGFIFVYEDWFNFVDDPDLLDGFRIFVKTWPKYKEMMLAMGLNIKEKPNLEKAPFILKNK